MVRDELITSRGELRESLEELRAANGDLCDKVAQLDAARREASEARALMDVARREAFEAINLVKRLSEECRGLRGDLHQQITLVAQRDEVIGRLRDQASSTRSPVAHFDELIYSAQATLPQESDQFRLERHQGRNARSPVAHFN